MRIAMLAPCPFPTHQGTQVLVRHLATTLAERGHEVHLITYGKREYDEAFPFHVHRTPNIASSLRSGPGFAKPAADGMMLHTALKVIRAYHCDVIHAHNVEGLGIGALLKLQTHLPLVYHAHNAMGPELPTYFKTQVVQSVAGFVGDMLDRTLPKAADAVIVFDEDLRAMYEVHGVRAERLFVIPPGLRRSELGAPSRERVNAVRAELGPGPVLLYAGNPDGYQNLPLLWRAFRQIHAARPDAQLLVATSHDPSTFEAELQAADLGMARSRVQVRTYRSTDELLLYYAAADVGLSPRTLWCGAPIKILNYLAMGLPVVACRGAARHLIKGPPHVLCDDTPESFATGVLAALDSPRGRPRAAFSRFRIEEHMPLYEQVYRTIMAGAPTFRAA